jgi:mannose-1-phosphate guanylyltransferase/mannose-6-phosphate isomerase
MTERRTVSALILAGGSGTRLWPRSTDERPKPFLPLASSRSLLRETFDRAARVAGALDVWVSARASHAAILAGEFPFVRPDRVVLEPERRNTAPAIALSALAIAEKRPETVMVVLPSDQAVRDEDAFAEALEEAVDAALAGDAFVTIGIPPTRPETGFGYLETEGEGAVRRVVTFCEKPDRTEAERYVASGRFLWNAGIFVFRIPVLLAAMERLCPDVLTPARAAWRARRAKDDAGFARAFAEARSVSIDYAVMEKAERVLTVPCACGWSDLGSWDAVYEFRGGDGARNVTDGGAVCQGGTGNLVLCSSRPVRVLGLSDVVVVDGPDGLLVTRRGASDLLRASVEESLAAVRGAR